jgi:hypothetical protein
MAFYGAWLAIFFLLPERWLAPLRLSKAKPAGASAMALLPLHSFFESASPAWYEAARTRGFHYLTRWPWYGWVGIFAPWPLFAWFAHIGKQRGFALLRQLSLRLIAYGVFIFLAAAVLTVPRAFERLTPYQPMRGYHLLYIFLFLFAGGLLGEFVLKARAWRWLALFLPFCLLMFFVQTQTMPATPHIEWPGAAPQNPWLQAFDWIRQNTPKDAYFALDPDYIAQSGDDAHGFRPFAERSMMADELKDSGVALLFPAVAGRWQREVHARDGWQHFTPADFARLRQQFGVDWVLLQRDHPAAARMDCLYQNSSLTVCRIGAATGFAPQRASD